MSGVSRVSCPLRLVSGAGSRIAAEHGSWSCSCESMRGEIARNLPLPWPGLGLLSVILWQIRVDAVTQPDSRRAHQAVSGRRFGFDGVFNLV